MAYTNDFADVITGLGSFAQGYQQGKMLREDRDMQRAQFEQQQKLAGLQYDAAKAKYDQQMRDREIADQSVALARATMTGDWDTASMMHNRLTGGAISAVREHDANSVKVIRPDGTFAVVPKNDYAEIAAAGNDIRAMGGAINRIMTAENKFKMVEQQAEARGRMEAFKADARSKEKEKERDWKSEENDKKLKQDWEKAMLSNKTRLSVASMRGSGGSGRGAGGGPTALMRNTDYMANLYEKVDGLSPEDARRKAADILTKSGVTESQRYREANRVLGQAITGDAGPEARKIAREMMTEQVKNIQSAAAEKKTPAPKKAQASTGASGGVDFAAHGFKQDKATGNWQNPKTGVYFRNNGGKTEAWSNTSKSWVPVQ